VTSDVWANAANKTAAQNNTNQPQSNSNTAGQSYGTPVTTPIDVDNPFAKQSQAAAAAGGGGQWDPRVPFDALEGRMVVLVPKSYRDDAPVPEAFNPKQGDVREEYRVDLIVLDGGPLSYEYTFKASKDAESEKKTMDVVEFPHVARGQTVAQGQLIRALKGAEKSGQFLYGVMTRVPQLRDAKQYPTPEALAAARKEWIANLSAGKSTPEPRYTWGLDERPAALTPERVNLAVQWWEKEKAARLADAS